MVDRLADIDVAKSVVRSLWPDVSQGPTSWEGPRVERLAVDVRFHGPAPIGSCDTRADLVERFYQPLARSFPVVHRSPYLFLGGVWNEEVWIATTGDLIGSLVEPFGGVRPIDASLLRFRFGEFYRVVDGEIVEIRCLVDLPGLAAQTGVHITAAVSRRR